MIYLCRRDVFEGTGQDKMIHFDTRNHLTIVWSEDTIVDDVERLKAAIQETLPSEAK